MKSIHLILCFLLILSVLMVCLARNQVESVVFLLTTFCISAAILLMFKIEFLAMIFVMVYAGALAVLFLFVIMMLNIKNDNNSYSSAFIYNNYNQIIAIFSAIYIFILSFGLKSLNESSYFSIITTYSPNYIIDDFGDLDVLGQVLFNNYYTLFLIAGIVLLVALLGAIVLTLNFNELKKSRARGRLLSRKDKFISFFS